jgi:hypothetical protein
VPAEESTKSDPAVETPAVCPMCRADDGVHCDVDEFGPMVGCLAHQVVQPGASKTSKISSLKVDRLP